MKMNIQINKIETSFLRKNQEIVNIDINNGHWKYWDNLMETDEKISLTMNNIREATYLAKPVKDAYGFHDYELWENERKLEIESADVRTYDTLHEYLNCRIMNFKEDYSNKSLWKIMEYENRTYTAVLFEEKFNKDNDVVADITYESEVLIEVKITPIE